MFKLLMQLHFIQIFLAQVEPQYYGANKLQMLVIRFSYLREK